MTQNWHKTCPTAFLERSHSDLGDGRKVATGPARPHSAFSERPHPVVITYTEQAGDAVRAGADSQGLRPRLQVGKPCHRRCSRSTAHITKGLTGKRWIRMLRSAGLNSVCPIPASTINPSYHPAILRQEWGFIVPGGESSSAPKMVTSFIGPVPQAISRLQWPDLGTITQGDRNGHRASTSKHPPAAPYRWSTAYIRVSQDEHTRAMAISSKLTIAAVSPPTTLL